MGDQSMSVQPEESNQASKKNPVGELHGWFREILICMSMVTLVFVFLVRLVSVDGNSMLPTLHNYDMMVLLSSVIYEPEAGDIIVLRAPGYTQPLVKRIIATEGQTVDIDFAAGVVYVDGVALKEEYVAEPTFDRGDQPFPQTVAEGCVFVLGDNRNHSSDSRYALVGQVPEEQILGKVLMVVWPLEHLGGVE